MSQAQLFPEPDRWWEEWDEPAPAAVADHLRWYQRECAVISMEGFATFQRQLVVMATGLGKTELGIEVARLWNEGDVLITAPRRELVYQWRDRLSRLTGELVEIEMADETSSTKARFVVASDDSLSQARLDRLGRGRFGLQICDECFPAGTLVDGCPIEKIRPGETVLGLDHLTGEIGQRRVLSVQRNANPGKLVTLRCGSIELRCTENHPCFVKGFGYVQAKDIVPGDLFAVWQRIYGDAGIVPGSTENLLECVLGSDIVGLHGSYKPGPRKRQDDREESNEKPGDTGQGVRHAKTHRAWPSSERRQRNWTYELPVEPIGGARAMLGSGVRGTHWFKSGKRLPIVLQAGPGATGPKVWSGARRGESLFSGAEATGCEEGCVLAWSRVDSVETEEFGVGGLVYNLTVEGAHTYFANGVLVHNCHHILAPTRRRAVEFFDCKLLGLTATPDRGDEKALKQVFEEVAYLFDIQQGIESGYLVPIHARTVEVQEIDLSDVHAARAEGGLNISELDDAMLKAVEGIVVKTLELEPTRRGIWFWPGVRSAEFACNRINHFRPGSCGFVSGDTPDDEREEIIRQFREGRLQHLSGCMVFTEGFDAPSADMVVLGRPTKSRALATQTVGRGTRVLPGVVDHLPGRENDRARREAIAASAKPNLQVLDFVGNMGKHSLISPIDILGGNFTPAEIEVAKKKAKAAPGADQLEMLEQARAELRALAARAQGKVIARVQAIDPFRLYGVKVNHDSEAIKMRFGEVPISPGQYEALIRWGLSKEEVGALTKSTASKLITAAIKRREKGLATFKQVRQLQKFGITEEKGSPIRFDRATAAMNYLQQKGWGERGDIDPVALRDIVNHR